MCTGIQQAFRVFEAACENRPLLLLAGCSDVALDPDKNCSLDIRIEALQGDNLQCHLFLLAGRLVVRCLHCISSSVSRACVVILSQQL